jgi:hypothetical protein
MPTISDFTKKAIADKPKTLSPFTQSAVQNFDIVYQNKSQPVLNPKLQISQAKPLPAPTLSPIKQVANVFLPKPFEFKLESKEVETMRLQQQSMEKGSIIDVVKYQFGVGGILQNSKNLEKATQPILEGISARPEVQSALRTISQRTTWDGIKATMQAKDTGKTFEQAYTAIKQSRATNDDTWQEQFVTQLKNTAPQTLLGVALNFVPYAGKPLSMTYFGLLSAADQLESTGKVSSATNIAIDTVGDNMLSNTLESLFKKPTKTLLSTVAKTFTTEGGTEVAQDLLKYSNNFNNAHTPEEKMEVLRQAKRYFTSGQILMTAGVGGIVGAGIGAGAYGIDVGIQSTKNVMEDEVKRLVSQGYTEDEARKKVSQGGFVRLSQDDNIPPELQSLAEEARKYKSAEEFVKAQTARPDYGYGHSPNADGVPAFDLTQKVDGEQMIPKDMYTQWYGSRGTPTDLESISVLKKIKGNPEANVTIYRASPKNEWNYGDWITLSKKYAQQHAEGNNGFKVFSKAVKAKDLKWAMDDVNEFGYFPESTKSQLTDIWNKANKAIQKNVTVQDMQEETATVISADKLKDIYGDYDPANARKYSKESVELFDEVLQSNENPTVKFSGGIPGSGKTDFLISEMKKDFDGVIFDTTMSNYSSVRSLIERVVKAGKIPELNYVIQNPEVSWGFVQSRAQRTGREVDLDYFIDKASELPVTLKRILEEFPKIKVRIKDLRDIDTREEALNTPILDSINNKKAIFDIINNLEYNKDSIRSAIQNYDNTRNQQEARRIEPNTRRGEGRNGQNEQVFQGESRRTVGLPTRDGADQGLNLQKNQPLTKEEGGFVLPKKKTAKEQLAEREQAKLQREQEKLKRESLVFFEGELENQYQRFKKLKVKDAEDDVQLKRLNKDLPSSAIDNILYSQEKNGDEVLEMFQARYEKERVALPQIPKETKAIVAEKVRQKARVIQKETMEKVKAAYDKKVAAIKDNKEILQRRRTFIRAVQNQFGLTDNDLKSITRRDIRLMTNAEFHTFLDDVRTKSEQLAATRQAKNELMAQIQEKELDIESMRQAMNFPPISQMTMTQLREMDKAIEPFMKGDVFLSKRIRGS